MQDDDETPFSSTEATDTIKLKKGLNFSTFISIKPGTVRKDKRKGRKKLEKLLLKSLDEKRKRNHGEKIAEQNPNEGTADQQETDKIDRSVTELNWQIYNAKTVLRCSNATPISRINDQFGCPYCHRIYDLGLYLKMHILDDHSKMEKPDFVQIKSLSRYIVYMDVTDLKCSICSGSIENIEDLLDHLRNTHGQLIHENLNNHIIPMKFDSEDDFKCVLCLYSFENFDKLVEHMNHHYRNYNCEFCGAGFINRVMVIDHKKAVHNYVQKIKYKQGEVLQ